MKILRAIYRFLFFGLYTAWIVLQIGLGNWLFGKDIRRSMRIRRKWARRLLPAIGVKLTVSGTIPEGPCLLVANHRSYLDPILILQDVDVFPVAKAELAKWPLIGKGAAMAGILYLKREETGSRVGTLKQMIDKIQSGFPVLIFPEGTTSSRPDTLPFKKGGFKMAAQNGIPVVPAVICFPDPADFWVGKTTFLAHAAKRFVEPEIRVSVVYGNAMTHTDAGYLLEQAQSWINQTLITAK
ncbi:MAG: 1-acyl-sn-glycerol-3-phosphate acyltransferase [Saprospiraceae bacterium]|nr:1-acyl-sn-glycerol-3-phosphate acyltransferase [Saprospiraceae bacterium]